MKHSMIIKKAFRPGGSGSAQTIVGDEIEATGQQRNLWKALKWADDAPPKVVKSVPPPARVYQAKIVEPEVIKPYVKRTYMRRDMTAIKPTDE